MTVAIQVENLGKKYMLGQAQQERYSSLRDVLANKAKSIWTRDKLQKSNEEFWALNDVGFSINQGDRVGIIGRNGAGKSTLLKLLSRITEPSRGRIKIKGRVASLLEVGTGFHPELTGRENIYLNGAILGMSKFEIKRKFDEIVAFAEVERFLDTPVKRYSSGMYVRLAFAVAAHLEPEILVVDEVLAVGDAQFQKKCLGRMEQVGNEGRTVLFVSHSMQAVKHLCNKGILLNHGETSGTTSIDAAVSEYLAFNKMNDINAAKQIEKLPPDPIFRLLDVGLEQDGIEVSQMVENGRDLDLTIHYEVKKTTPALRVFFDLVDDQDNLLLRSFHDETSEGMSLMNAGIYKSRVKVPKDFLAPIRYYLRVYATIYNERYLYPGSIEFNFDVERTGLINRSYPMEPIRGRLAPSLYWETKRED
jgi:lipopolysaccharide transport system ATP-binding protein